MGMEKDVILRRISKAMEHGYHRIAVRSEIFTSVPSEPHRKMNGFESESKRLRATAACLACHCHPIEHRRPTGFFICEHLLF